MARQVSGGEQCGGGWSGAARLSRVLDDVERLCAELGEMSRRQGMDLDEGRAEDAAAVGAVLARDAEDAELLRGERDRLSSEMSGLGRGKSAIGAYGGARDAGPTMQDREG